MCALGAAEVVPIGDAGAIFGKTQTQPVECYLLNHDFLAQQGQQFNLYAGLTHLGEGFFIEAGGVGQRHGRQLGPQPREEGERDLAVDLEIAAGMLFDDLDNIVFVFVGVHHQRQDDSACNQQSNDTSQGNSQYL